MQAREHGHIDPGLYTPVDVFGLDCDKFVEEQERVPWMRAFKAFQQDEALALDSQLKAVC
ncbi:hypothetical protein L914_18754 [Phytophthora nicotianae]|uniref:Uncharacterized protein n=1 Tax=Phytophthora nicotianae TaxID=4792 RepID=W2MEK6_PHYNI|nr:hypothetical protein L914_18754 [Phytophthora nicotianae]